MKDFDALNASAIALYKEHGIDLEQEALQIAVCAQHNNGGLKANIWWESDLKHLFPVGEVNGSHGVYRPGGSALNSGQVGSLRAAQYISKKYIISPMEDSGFLSEMKKKQTILLAAGCQMDAIRQKSPDNRKYLSEIRRRMSDAGGIIRDKQKVADSLQESSELLNTLQEKIGADSVNELADAFQLMDHCLTHFVYLSAINAYIAMGGRSRGSYIVTDTTGRRIRST